MKKTRTFSIDADIYERLGQVCKELQISRSFVCDALLTNFVNAMGELDYEEKYIYISRFLLQSINNSKKVE